MTGQKSEQGQTEENRLIAERRAKLAALRERGIAFPNDFRPLHTAAGLLADYAGQDDWPQERLQSERVEVKVAGRIMSRRVMGKASFFHIQDGSGERVQIYLRREDLSAGSYEDFKNWDIGDIAGVSGVLMRTKTGELSVHAGELRLLVKSLRPLPEKWHGLTDTETRYRRRYLDLIVNPAVRRTFETRALILGHIRDFFAARGFLEVETPMMHHIPGGAAARPFATHHNALDLDLYLRVAPELHLKRLVVGGLDRVFEINRSFRNEGVSTRHNPEFTMLEFYQAFADYSELMDLTELLMRELAVNFGKEDAKLEYQGIDLDFGPDFPRLDLAEAVVRHNPDIEPAELRDPEKLATHCDRLGIRFDETWGWGARLMAIFEHTVEPELIQPTFITAYPTEVSPLSRRNDEDPEIAERFELFIAGREIANGFSELNDPEDQAARFAEQARAKAAGDDEAMHYDDDYIRALEYGLPPCAGEGIGIDRLVMLLTDSASIRDVLLFPYLRPEGG